jgi:hypothetical protein
MKMTDELVQLWIDRAGADVNWLIANYEAAVAGVHDRSDEVEPVDYVGTSSDWGISRRGLYDDQGLVVTIENARSIAFEILALADLAEIEGKK